jgi:hypothetical protein
MPGTLRTICGLLLAAGMAVACNKAAGPGGGAAVPLVAISEIMYHPVGEQTAQDLHEFVELHNPGRTAVSLAGWRLVGGVRFTFAQGTSLAPGAYLVVAKHRDSLLALASYALDPARVVGDYDGELDNDGERVALDDAQGNNVDEVIYDDRFPWPLGADGLGAGEGWLADDHLGGRPLEAHRFLGRSLERVSFTEPARAVGNWAASPLDGATPGRPGAAVLGGAVEALELRSAGTPVVRSGGRPAVRVRFSGPPPAAPEIEFFVDDVERSDEALSRAALEIRGDGWFEATLPGQTDNAIVRYRVVGDRGGGREAISPRPSDPSGWHAYFVTPASDAGNTPAYHLFISKANWEAMWDFIEPGRVPGHVGTLGGKPGFCTPNPLWNARVSATLVVGNRVYDVQTRYQGSSVGRTGGPRNIDPMAWPATVAMPARPVPFRPLSWRINFPRHNRLGNKAAIHLNKLSDAQCLGFSYGVGVTLFEQAGLPAGEPPSYVRLHVNGAYYHYMQRMERVDEELIDRFYGDDHQMGDLFKSTGIRWEQGPFDWGDERILHDACGYSAAERYDWTYSRQSLTDRKQGSAEVKQLIETLHQARAGGVAALRRFFDDTFDRPQLTSYMAIRNWLGPWDDYFHNHYLYRRSDGRWLLIPNDFDGELGINGLSAVESSFFNGRENDRSNRNNWMNYLKDSYLQAYRDEHIARLRELSLTVLHPGNVEAVVDRVMAAYDLGEAKAAPTAVLTPMLPLCSLGDAPAVAARLKSFARRRHERLLDGYFD